MLFSHAKCKDKTTRKYYIINVYTTSGTKGKIKHKVISHLMLVISLKLISFIY